jgi:hypothetical protein
MMNGEFFISHEKQLSRIAFLACSDNILRPAVADNANKVEFLWSKGTCSSANVTNPFIELPASCISSVNLNGKLFGKAIKPVDLQQSSKVQA